MDEQEAQNNEEYIFREFGKTATKNCQYKIGKIIDQETGSGSNLNASREFKLFNFTPDDYSKLERSFIKRVARFTNACMNRRCNGTIYFGVADNKGEYLHGEIVGLKMGKQHGYIFEDWITKYFRGTKPACYKNIKDTEMLAAVSSAISPVYVIPTSDPDLCILEIDIEPRDLFCKDIFFPINYPDGENKWKVGYFLREGPNNNPIHDIKDFQRLDFKTYVNERRFLDSCLQKSENKQLKLQELLLGQDSFINQDKDKKFFLFCDTVNEDTELEKLQWTSCVDWTAIFDFDPRSNIGGLWDKVETLSIRNSPYLVGDFAKIIEENENSKARQLMNYGFQCSWLQCANPEEDFKQWSLQVKASILSILNFYTNPNNISSKDKAVFVFGFFNENLQSKDTKMITEIIKHCVSICGGTQRCVFVAENSKILQEYQKLLTDLVDFDDWQNRSVQIPWNQLTSFVEGNNRYKLVHNLKIPSSSGVEVTIRPEVVDHYQKSGVNILGMNQCQHFQNPETRKEEHERIAKERTEAFLNGDETAWEIFMLSEPSKLASFEAVIALIERDITGRIITKIEALKNSDNFISILALNHNPGAGATTVGKHILWKMKEKFRCCYIDNDMVVDKTPQILLNYPILKEGTVQLRSKLKPVLVFLDNASSKAAQQLKENLDMQASNNRTLNMSAKFIVLYADQQVELQSNEEKLQFNLPSLLNEKEQSMFKSKLDIFEKNYGFRPEDMISFVIMANGFDEDNEHVRKVVYDNLKKVTNKRQEKLLHILSIYKFFSHGNENLSFKICDLFLGKSPLQIMERLELGVSRFIRSKTASEEGYGNYEVIEVTHRPIAKQVLKYLNTKYETHAQKVLLDFFQEPAIRGIFFKNKTLYDIHSLLVDRGNFIEGEEFKEKRPKFSPLIECIQKQFNPPMVIDLLQSGYQVTKEHDSSGAHIAQTIARFLIYQSEFEAARHWAEIAVQTIPKNPSFHDTLGQVYKRELYYLEKDKFESRVERKYAIQVAKASVKHFREAQQIIEAMFVAKKSQKENSNCERYTRELINKNTSYFGEIEVNLTLASLLIGLSADLNTKKAIAKFLRGVPDENEVERKFTEKIEDWREFIDFLSNIDERTMHCMTQIQGLLDSNSWKKMMYNPIDILCKFKKQRLDLHFGKMFNHISLRNEHAAKNNLREALRSNLVTSMIR